ncbi:hypothetical protein [uncultured Draconibacterium sp.]|uniref:hypothetical protein n=1 Tax=uncultured Draconibacterium sp. TaxID=1573823 RepID=UPI002AA840DB|nr:hypothetical protein [uncultured Draconibacterium sp.]
MRLKIIIVCFLFMALNSCDNFLGKRYVKEVKQSKRDFENCYQVKGLFNHFPESISNNSFIRYISRIPSNTFDSESVYSAGFMMLLDMVEDSENYHPQTYIYKTNYSNLNFVLDDSFYYYQYSDTLKIRNIVQPDAYPIPYFERFDFDLGFERIDLRDTGITLIRDKHNVPEDLEVYVVKAGHGNFWKTEFEQERPETLGDWKNGYSSGVAISKELNKIVYWMMAW